MPTQHQVEFPFCEAAYKNFEPKTHEDCLLDNVEVYVCSRTPTISPVVKRLMAISLTNFIIKATHKFAAGQTEHGGDIRDRDLTKEIQQEHIDLFWYTEATKWPNHLR